MTDLLPPTESGIARAAALLAEGALVALPTDTVYGLACHVGDSDALRRLFEAKRRPAEKRIPILVSDLDQAVGLGYSADERALQLAGHFWPGALTIVLPRAGGGPGPAGAAGEPTQAFRAPAHAVALELIRRSGPLATTSANRSGEPDTYDADDVLVAFADTDQVAAVIDGGQLGGGAPSTVVDISGARARLVREGPVAGSELQALIGPID